MEPTKQFTQQSTRVSTATQQTGGDIRAEPWFDGITQLGYAGWLKVDGIVSEEWQTKDSLALCGSDPTFVIICPTKEKTRGPKSMRYTQIGGEEDGKNSLFEAEGQKFIMGPDTDPEYPADMRGTALDHEKLTECVGSQVADQYEWKKIYVQEPPETTSTAATSHP